MDRVDYAVIGSGPGGYVSAIRAAQLGLKTVVIEKAEVGGVCLNWGCIPTKALLHLGHLYQQVKKETCFRHKEKLEPDLHAMVQHSREVASRLSRGIESLFRKYKVELIRGHAYIEAPGKLHIRQNGEKKDLVAEKICIATGARARELPHIKFSSRVISYREALVPQEIPRRFLVIGAGAIGCEFADFYNCLGSEVTLVEVAKSILPLEEEALSSVLTKAFEERGIRVFVNTTVSRLEENQDGLVAQLDQGGQVFHERFDQALLAVGVVANIEDLGFENTGGFLDKGVIKVDEYCRVSGSRNIFAIGDVIGGKQLAHKASHEGLLAAEVAAGKKVEPLNSLYIPSCIYTNPQIASVGYKESELKTAGIPYEIGSFPFAASGKALALGEAVGFCRIYLHKETGELLGAHLVGPEVTDLISHISLAFTGELSYHEFAHAVAPHPTLAESLFEAVLAAKGRSCNI
ncbi:MAG: dihydrolipoyl dehydrogenase [Leptospiraceae bacterium]|nr:dihydrolipoyl dehydrogenase [Leptospiraceae bacterium]MDW8306826.1 dihydrolipoyl dehydrogenase [Leptospiraceae bacterium]